MKTLTVILVLVSCSVVMAQKTPSILTPLLPAEPKLADLVAARNIMTASVVIDTSSVLMLNNETKAIYDEYKKIKIYIKKLKDRLGVLNKSVADVDAVRRQKEKDIPTYIAARKWLDTSIRLTKDAISAGMPEDVTDFVKWLEDERIVEKLPGE